jgi:hypothetical protein
MVPVTSRLLLFMVAGHVVLHKFVLAALLFIVKTVMLANFVTANGVAMHWINHGAFLGISEIEVHTSSLVDRQNTVNGPLGHTRPTYLLLWSVNRTNTLNLTG